MSTQTLPLKPPKIAVEYHRLPSRRPARHVYLTVADFYEVKILLNHALPLYSRGCFTQIATEIWSGLQELFFNFFFDGFCRFIQSANNGTLQMVQAT